MESLNHLWTSIWAFKRWGRLKPLSHMSHLNGLSPVCRKRWSDKEKLLSHIKLWSIKKSFYRTSNRNVRCFYPWKIFMWVTCSQMIREMIVVNKEKIISHIKSGCPLFLPMKVIYLSDMFINDKRFHWDTHWVSQWKPWSFMNIHMRFQKMRTFKAFVGNVTF